jgi:drug/metabolite transporter, DME family
MSEHPTAAAGTPATPALVTDGHAHRNGALLVAAGALLWSTGGLFIKLVPLPGLALACARAVIAAAFYLGLLRPDLRRARWATALAFAATIITFVCATKLTTAANAIFLQYTAPGWVLLLSPWLLGEKLRRADVLAVALSLCGMSLFFAGKVDAGQATGNLIGVASGVFFALSILFMRRDARGSATRPGDSLPSIALGNLIGAAVCLPFSLPAFAALAASPPRTLWLAIGGLLWLGVVQIGVAYVLVGRGLRRVSAAEASVLTMLEALFNPIWVVLGMGERPSGWALAGGAVVLSAVLLRTTTARA